MRGERRTNSPPKPRSMILALLPAQINARRPAHLHSIIFLDILPQLTFLRSRSRRHNFESVFVYLLGFAVFVEGCAEDEGVGVEGAARLRSEERMGAERSDVFV